MPLDDEFDRETFYRGKDPEADNEDDYELMPPDEAVIAGEKQRAAEAMERASMAVDVDELYREDTSVSMEDIEAQLRDFKFQFGTKHLLIAMTVVAITIIFGRLLLGGWLPILIVVVFGVLASAYGWITWKENQHRREWEAKRDELYRRNQARHRQESDED
ncbi:hypothetical protein [Aeoliella mucimassa]|uniref:2TM domain-containing protein n=1 Tax=Aeoliella mucimassa TaxID=2527972 RepID=A0A518AIP2_9BACT|nr:hypothetical protein [Aeoliella mucimassa]QDU54592.1 hypothetical protein Pan181_07750 [Aeoliella mucimassa]